MFTVTVQKFFDMAARVANVHEVVKQCAMLTWRQLTALRVGQERALQASAGANSRREINRIGANKLRSRPYSIDPFADANRKEENEVQKQADDGSKKYTAPWQTLLRKKRAAASQGNTPTILVAPLHHLLI